MKAFNYSPRLVLVCAVPLLLSGCLFKPARVSTRQFVLAPIQGPGHASKAGEGLSVGIGSVKMPSYLLRDAVAVRKGPNEIEYLEDARWAERLDQSFQETLAANLSALLPSDKVYCSFWQRDQVKMKLFVHVEQFDVDTHGQGTLIAWWRITAPGNDELLKSGVARLARGGASPCGNPQASATTLSALISDLSRELVRALQESPRVKP